MKPKLFIPGPTHVDQEILDSMSQYPIVSLVPVLFFLGGPFAIIRRISAIIIYSLNGVIFAGPESHVIYEVFYRGLPFITYGTPPSAIIRV